MLVDITMKKTVSLYTIGQCKTSLKFVGKSEQELTKMHGNFPEDCIGVRQNRSCVSMWSLDLQSTGCWLHSPSMMDTGHHQTRRSRDLGCLAMICRCEKLALRLQLLAHCAWRASAHCWLSGLTMQVPFELYLNLLLWHFVIFLFLNQLQVYLSASHHLQLTTPIQLARLPLGMIPVRSYICDQIALSCVSSPFSSWFPFVSTTPQLAN